MRLTFIIFLCTISKVITEAVEGVEASCQSDCTSRDTPSSHISTSRAPYCGIWLQNDNLRQLSGIYVATEATVLLRVDNIWAHAHFAYVQCSALSLPTPATIIWQYKPTDSDTPKTLFCASLIENVHCRTNDRNEHLIESKCTLKLDAIEQSGQYYCMATAKTNDRASISNADTLPSPRSSEGTVHVYGIPTITIVEQKLDYSKTGYIQIKVCSNPPPTIQWIHNGSTIISSKSGHDKYELLPLSAGVERQKMHNGTIAPSPIARYCYLSQMIIAKVSSKADRHWAVIVNNGLLTKRMDLSPDLHIDNMVKSGHVSVHSALVLTVMIVCACLY